MRYSLQIVVKRGWFGRKKLVKILTFAPSSDEADPSQVRLESERIHDLEAEAKRILQIADVLMQ